MEEQKEKIKGILTKTEKILSEMYIDVINRNIGVGQQNKIMNLIKEVRELKKELE